MKYLLEHPVTAVIGTEKYKCVVEWRHGKFIVDEPEATGGNDLGPDPYTLLLSSLGTCTIATLRMYIDRKGWDVPQIGVAVNMYQELKGDKTITVIDRDVNFSSPVTDEQRERLIQIAKICPVSKILEGEIQIRTFAYSDGEEKNKHTYTNGDVTVAWKPDLCKHAARCATQLPTVFNPAVKPWVNMDGATSQEITDQVNKCPTGALSIEKK
ncbi:(4Fe-4S)-binding protein [Mucilaginibacter sp. X4EP1]|uniref:(4Fe-4S)-binding protein n=1 Tax=Mucilaginibacter sp. X4EP1 TaxID=2723092 RepID=UPI0021672A33|nr:(4Fe-4S)-binding protein [Mucilaginibacter sp. X4EP1]MCS3815259.1 putative redox protein [Mucilaginibacter sp. X4EP1]